MQITDFRVQKHLQTVSCRAQRSEVETSPYYDYKLTWKHLVCTPPCSVALDVTFKALYKSALKKKWKQGELAKHRGQPSLPVINQNLTLSAMDHSKDAMLRQDPPVFLHSREFLLSVKRNPESVHRGLLLAAQK